MLFNSLEYALFLLAMFVLFWGAARHRLLRTGLLLVGSWLFYMSWNASFILLIVASTVLDYVVALRIAGTERRGPRRALLAASLFGNLGMLCVFKYFDFFARAVSQGLGHAGLHVTPVQLDLILPVGISFYTFQTLSYTIDVYRRRITPTRSFLEFATFVAFFPQLVAGPIVRASEFLPQFDRKPTLDVQRAGEGVFLILRGLVKKVLLADFMAANFIDRVWDDPGAYSSGETWFATFAYNWQLYCDFSGYTDIARGSAMLFGFALPENFRRPFNTTGPIEFWNNWHITLSSWIRDYVYIPLGGSRVGTTRMYVNLVVSFLAVGIWHGAGWTYVLFALWHATTVALHRGIRQLRGVDRDAETPLGRVPLVALNLFLFTFHWVIFRAPDVATMREFYARMFAGDFRAFRAPWTVVAAVLAITVVHFTPRRWMEEAQRGMGRLPAVAQAAVVVAVVAALLWVGRGQAAPFIYFQF